MVSVGGGGGSSSRSGSWFPLGVAQTRKLARKGAAIAEPAVFGGDLTSPLARTLYNLASREGEKAVGEEQANLLSTPGIAQPVKAQTALAFGKKKIEAAANVPVEVWKQLAQMLAGYMSPSGQFGKSSQEGQWSGGILSSYAGGKIGG